MDTHSLWGFWRSVLDGTFRQKEAVIQRSYEKAAREKIWVMRSQCQ